MPTKLVTAAVLSGTGDLIAQVMEASAPFALKRLSDSEIRSSTSLFAQNMRSTLA